jgi:hypothetical protein
MQPQSVDGLFFVDYEVEMTVRRTHPRFVVDSPWDGVMHVLRDVAVNRIHPEEFAAVSTAPAVIGEVMSLHLMTESSNVALRVQVLESRPVVVNGSVRHEIRLGIESVSLMPTGGGLPEAV